MPFAKDTYILVLSFDKEYLKSMKPLRVGIDLTAIWRLPTGIFRYATEVAKHLLLLQEAETSIRYVYFDQDRLVTYIYIYLASLASERLIHKNACSVVFNEIVRLVHAPENS